MTAPEIVEQCRVQFTATPPKQSRIRFLFVLCLGITLFVSFFSVLSLRRELSHFLSGPHLTESQSQREQEEVRLRKTVDTLILASMLGAICFALIALFVESALNRLHARRLQSIGMFHAILHSAPCGIALLDRELRYLEINAAMAELTHVPLDQHRGRSLVELSPPWLFRSRDQLELSLTQRRRNTFEVREGDRNYVISCYPILVTGDEVFGLAVMITDITAQKEQERQLDILTTELRRSNNELERFAYLASHDLKEPIRMIATYLGLFVDEYGDRLDERARQYLSFPEEGAKRLMRLVDSLLQYGRLGQKEAVKGWLDLSSLLNEVVGSLSPAITETGAGVELPSQTSLIFADRTQCFQLFQNLISNAIKFSRHSVSPRIEIRVDEEADRWIVSVSDNGVGIPDGKREKIFELFCRLHSRAKYEGEGIGLAICKRVMDSHQGRIAVSSRAGGGSVFYASFPKPEVFSSHQAGPLSGGSSVEG